MQRKIAAADRPLRNDLGVMIDNGGAQKTLILRLLNLNFVSCVCIALREMERLRYFLLLSLLLACSVANAQVEEAGADSDTAKAKEGNTLVLVPLVFFTPETNWGTGAAGVYVYRPKGKRNDTLLSPSQFQFGFSYTLNKQFLGRVNFQQFWDENRYTVYGEVGYYRYNYNYWGIGNNIDVDDFEVYFSYFPRVRLNALRLVAPDTYVGLRYWGESFTLTDIEAGGKFDRGEVPGSAGGWSSGLGFTANYDTRDYYFFPSSGSWVEVGALFFQNFVGSAYSFNKYSLDARKFIGLKWGHILALNTYWEFNTGNPPYNLMAMVGGQWRMRGYYEGIYRDRHVGMLQAEYRAPLFWRLGVVAFGGVANVANTLPEFGTGNFRYNYGAGLRLVLNEKEKFNMRFDAGFGQGVRGLYVTVREAF